MTSLEVESLLSAEDAALSVKLKLTDVWAELWDRPTEVACELSGGEGWLGISNLLSVQESTRASIALGESLQG